MLPGSSRTIQKLEAARSQLQTAIKLWFAGGDPISIHTLTCAAHQILHDIHRHRGGSDLLFDLFDSIFVKENRRAEWTHAVKEHMNFFKHADNDPNGTIEFNHTVTEAFILLSLFSLEGLGQRLMHEESAFAFWSFLQNSDWVNDQWKDTFENRVPVEQLSELRNLPKTDFYRMFMVATHKYDVGK